MKTKLEQTPQSIGNENELSDEAMDQVVGGAGLLSSPLGVKYRRDATTGLWTREVVEDVEAY